MISSLFINRTRLAMVLSIVISIAGALSIFVLPVQQYPEITPPTVSVPAVYPGRAQRSSPTSSVVRSRPRSTGWTA